MPSCCIQIDAARFSDVYILSKSDKFSEQNLCIRNRVTFCIFEYVFSSSASSTRKEALALNLFSSVHLERIVSLLVLSFEDYIELLACFVLSVNVGLEILPRFLRLIHVTEEVYRLSLTDGWMERLRERCLNGNPINGLLFVSALFYQMKRNERTLADADAHADEGDWSKMLDEA